MSFEPIGLLIVLVGASALWLGLRALLCAFLVATLLGAAAVFISGSISIPPGQLMLAFVAVGILYRGEGVRRTIDALKFPKAGFWLAALVVYGIVSAVFLPRLLAGWTNIIPLGDSQYATSSAPVPLGPVSSNFTQPVYLVGSLMCFALSAAVASTEDGLRKLTIALLAYAGGNVVFALLDIATFSTGAQWLFAPIRNGQYALHQEETIVGLKRIIGSFTEASVFARSTLGALGFTATLWLCGRYVLWSGPLAVVSFVLSVLSTSSSGLAALAPALVLLYVTLLLHAGLDPRRPFALAVILIAPLVAAAAVLLVLINEPVLAIVQSYLDVLIFNKASSLSGVERSTWNTVALTNFIDSYGLGVGLGTARTSSFAVALISNVGILGTLFYLAFLIHVVIGRRSEFRTYVGDVKLAARNGCLCLLMADVLAASSVDQGLLFYVLAAVACASPAVIKRGQVAQTVAGRSSTLVDEGKILPS
jgi:hypothetical protein